MMNYRFAHTAIGGESHSSGHETLHTDRNTAADAPRTGFAAGLAAVFRSIARQRRYRKTVSELSRLDDRTLRDIGLERDEIAYVARGLSKRSDGWPLY